MNAFLRNVIAGGLAVAAGGWLIRQLRRYDFRHKTVLITGGSRGLGLVLARMFVEEKARVVICARDEDELRRAVEHLRIRGGDRVMGVPCDMADKSQIDAMMAHIRREWGEVDVLVNNAGIIQVGPMHDMTLDDFEQAMRVHYWGPLHAMLAVIPAMRRRQQGRIVNIASIGGIISVPHLLPYNASKFALTGLSEGMRVELLQDNVFVTTVCPGLMRTGSVDHAQFKGRQQMEYVWFSASASAPIISMNAERAAAQILRACRYGRANIVLSLPARLVALVHGIAPGIIAESLALANRLLPSANGATSHAAPGHEVRPDWLPRWVTAGSDAAAEQNNQLEPTRAEMRLQR